MEKQNKEAISKYQKFEIVTLNRADIQNAEYNPRKISDDARKKLKKNIEKVGLLDTIVVNKNTMNIVSGHQRIAIIDSLERKKDYLITVSLVDLTEEEEKSQNIFFNNTKAQGEYDINILSELINDIDIEHAGLDYSDLAIIGVDYSHVFKIDEDLSDVEKNMVKINNQVYEDKYKAKKEMEKINSKRNIEDKDNCIILSFDKYENKEAFLDRFDFENGTKFIKGEIFSEMIERVE